MDRVGKTTPRSLKNLNQDVTAPALPLLFPRPVRPISRLIILPPDPLTTAVLLLALFKETRRGMQTRARFRVDYQKQRFAGEEH